MSNVSSANFRFAASICSSRTLRTPLRSTRSRAFSSIGLDRSMPVTEQSDGYNAALMPVPTPTSSTRSPAGMERRAERDVVEPGDVLVDARDEIVVDDAHGQCASRGVGPDNFVAFTRLMRLK